MPVNRRVLIGSMGLAVAVSLVGGWVLSRVGGTADDDDSITVLQTPGTAQIPSIETNPRVSGDLLPAVDFETNDGATISSSDLIGQPMVLNYWYSTCAPCKKELPDFAAAHADYGDRVRFVGINPLDTPAVNESFARARGVQYELLRDPDGAYRSEIQIATAPFTLFVAADGTIVRQAGVLDLVQLREYVEELLA